MRGGIQRWQSVALWTLALSAVVFSLAWLCIHFTRENDRIAAVWLANGAVVAALLLHARRDWGVLISGSLLANLAANLASGDSWAFATMLSGINQGESLLTAIAVKPLFDNVRRIDDLPVVVRLLADAALPAERRHPDKPVGAESVENLTVLVAEDNPVNQLLIGAILKRLGHRVDIVENGLLAVEACRDRRYDVVLMDMQMPEMDGLAATRAIRSAGGDRANLPIVALTADASPERRRFYDGVGLTHFMTKPIDQDQLADLLSRISTAPTAVTSPGVEIDRAI